MPELTVAWLLPEGRAGGRADDGSVVALDRGLPGDRLAWTERARRGRVTEGVVDAILRPSPDRQTATCPVQARCGGCDLAELREDARRPALAAVVQRALHLDAPPEVVPSPRSTGHRARIKLVVEAGQYGYRAPGSHTHVPLDRCPIARPEIAAAMAQLAPSVAAGGLDGVSVEFRSDGARVVASLHGPHPAEPPRPAALAFPDVAWNGRTVQGDPRLELLVAGQRLRASPLSFYQVNLEANEALVRHVVSELAGAERVLDLYAGIGNLSLPLAAGGRPVVAVELEGQATADLTHNAHRAGLPVEVITGKVERFDARRVAFDAVVLDPPRTGAPGVLTSVLANRPKQVVFVACDPVTGARDLREATALGYAITAVRCFDLFPDTHHIETVVTLRRRDASPGRGRSPRR